MLSEGRALYVPGVGQWDGKDWTYELPDGLGSVRQLADAQGYLVQRYDYAPFGEVLASEGNRINSLRYTGEQWDSDVGLLYLRARWYDPSVGRFTTRDLFPGFPTLPQTQHSYVYVNNNPLRNTDPSGHFAFLVPLVTGAIGGVAGGAGSLIGQVASGQGTLSERWANVNWRNVGIAAGVGAVAGAVAPFVATSAIGAVALSATANVVQYSLTQWANNRSVTNRGVAVSALTGGVAGWIAGPVSNDGGRVLFDAASPWLERVVAEAANTAAQLGPVLTASHLGRSLLSTTVSNWKCD
jgi:RHS repeat-associated protein